jgi:hypothetical protein
MSWLSKYEEKNLLKNFGIQYERYKTSESGDGYEANECRGDFVGWLAVDIHRENHEGDCLMLLYTVL